MDDQHQQLVDNVDYTRGILRGMPRAFKQQLAAFVKDCHEKLRAYEDYLPEAKREAAALLNWLAEFGPTPRISPVDRTDLMRLFHSLQAILPAFQYEFTDAAESSVRQVFSTEEFEKAVPLLIDTWQTQEQEFALASSLWNALDRNWRWAMRDLISESSMRDERHTFVLALIAAANGVEDRADPPEHYVPFDTETNMKALRLWKAVSYKFIPDPHSFNQELDEIWRD